MDNRIPVRREEESVEYVEAEPIDDTGAPAAMGDPADSRRPFQPHVYTYYHRSDTCVPCCGPIGCSILLVVVFALMGSPELLRGALYAAAILIGVSLLSQVFLGRR